MENLWQNFIEDLEIEVNTKISNLFPHREFIFKDVQLRKKIILTEIKINKLNSPFEIIDKNFTNEYYDTNLLMEQLKTISNIYNTTKSFPEIISRKDKLDSIRKIITEYLTYLVSNNFEKIINELIKLETTEKKIYDSIIMIQSLKENLTLFKQKYMISVMKTVLNKQKYNNLCQLKYF